MTSQIVIWARLRRERGMPRLHGGVRAAPRPAMNVVEDKIKTKL